MKRTFVCLLRVAAVTAALVLVAATGSAQTVATFLGGSGATDLAQTGWTTAGNWNPAAVPSGTGAWALINSNTATILRINYGSTSLTTGGTMSVGAISFLPTLALATGSTYEFRNSSTSTTGILRFFGVDTNTVDGQTRKYIMINSSTVSEVGVSQSGAGQIYEPNVSGAIHVAGGTMLTLSPLIRDGGGAGRSITKVGSGVLSFAGFSGGTNNSRNSTYSGGFVLEGGIVQWQNSGTANVGTPFGLGALTLRSGTLRSTGTSSRDINVAVVLDGSVELGSTVSGFTGIIQDVNSSGGSLSTTIASDSIVSIAGSGSTNWHQATSGTGSFTKAGPGLLRFSGAGGALTHTGSTVVSTGTLIMAANLSSLSPVSVQSAAALFGTGTIAGPTTILSGGVFSPGTQSGAIGLFTFGGGGLTLGGQTIMELAASGTIRGVDYDAINLGGSLSYGGALSLTTSGSLPNAAYELFRNFTSQGSTFTSISLSGFYNGSLTETAGVWAGTFGDQDITFTNATGVLAVVPEPSTLVLGGFGVLGVVAAVCRRVSGRRVVRPEDRGCASAVATSEA